MYTCSICKRLADSVIRRSQPHDNGGAVIVDTICKGCAANLGPFTQVLRVHSGFPSVLIETSKRINKMLDAVKKQDPELLDRVSKETPGLDTKPAYM